MPRYLISFPDGAMKLSEEELARAGVESHAVVEEAKRAGVWIFGGGIDSGQVTAGVAATDGTIVLSDPDRTAPVGGFSVVDVASREEACAWAAKIAAACRCEQVVWELLPDDAV
ncbi:YciI family protein [Mumia sp. DW29H23]|uniref:YciI family protein n=1 Tax=Mumia sp. DW29H23 TaxID=3421241 RepID=UPI003D681BB4